MTPADRLALAVCPYFRGHCKDPARDCRHTCSHDSIAVARELAAMLRERHGHSTTADWLEAVGSHQPES